MSMPEGVTRQFVPGLGDVVTISSPEILRIINDHPDIGRPDQGRLPAIVTMLLSATQFRSPVLNGGEYSVAFTTTHFNDQAKRTNRVARNLEKGFSEYQIEQMTRLVWSDLPEVEVSRELVKLVGPSIIGLEPGKQIPDEVITAMQEMNLESMNNPIQYFRGRWARRKVETWVCGLPQFKTEEHVIDIVHDIVNVYLGFARGLVTLRTIGSENVETHLCNNPVLPMSARTPLRTTTVGGLFPDDTPLERDRSVIVANNGEAAKLSQDIRFVFGMGTENRVCPFRHLFVSTCESVVANRD